MGLYILPQNFKIRLLPKNFEKFGNKNEEFIAHPSIFGAKLVRQKVRFLAKNPAIFQTKHLATLYVVLRSKSLYLIQRGNPRVDIRANSVSRAQIPKQS